MHKSKTGCFGFDILRRTSLTKLKFDEGGREGQIAFIEASILTGTAHPLQIIEAAVRVTGRHIEGVIETLIDEGENIHWGRSPNGKLYVIER